MTVAITIQQRLAIPRQQRAFALQRKVRQHNRILAKLFIWDALLLQQMRDQELWRELDHDPEASFYKWLADPANGIDSISRALLQLQVIDLYWSFFGIKTSLLHDIGIRKHQMLAPECELYRNRVEAGVMSKKKAVFHVKAWLAMGQTLSVTDLQQALVEQTISHDTTGRGVADTGQPTGGWQVLCSTPAQVGWLRKAAKDGTLLDVLGLADKSDSDRVVIEVKARSDG